MLKLKLPVYTTPLPTTCNLSDHPAHLATYRPTISWTSQLSYQPVNLLNYPTNILIQKSKVPLFATELDQSPTSFFQTTKVHYDLQLIPTLFDSIITTPTPPFPPTAPLSTYYTLPARSPIDPSYQPAQLPIFWCAGLFDVLAALKEIPTAPKF